MVYRVDRASKQKLIRRYSELFSSYKAIFFVRNHGLSVLDSRSVRSELRKNGAQFLFIKNSLARMALSDQKLSARKHLFGPVAIASSNNPIPLARLLVKMCNLNDRLDVVGAIDTDKVLSKDEVVILSKMPTQDEIRVRIIHLFNVVAYKVSTTLNEPAIRMVRVLQSCAIKKQ